MAESLGHRIWNRYVHPGVAQHSAAPIGVYRRLSLTNPDFASAIYNRQGSTNDSVSHEALPVVSLRPIRDESTSESSDSIERVSEITPLSPVQHVSEIAPSSAVQRVSEIMPLSPVQRVSDVAPSSVVQRIPDADTLPLPSIPVEREGEVTEKSPATEAAAVLPELPIVRPNAIQRTPDTTPLALPSVPIVSESHIIENNPAVETNTAPLERSVVRANAIQRAPDVTPLTLSSASVVNEVQVVENNPAVESVTAASENPVVPANGIQRAPDATPLRLPSAPVVREGQIAENNPAVETNNVMPEIPVVRPNDVIQRASDQLPIMRTEGNKNSPNSENIVVQAQSAHENTSTFANPTPMGISQTALAPLVFRSAVYRSPETNIVVQASPVSDAAPPRLENGYASPVTNTSPSLSAAPIIQRAEGDGSSSAEQSNSDELIDRMMQKFMRRLAVENERRGRRW